MICTSIVGKESVHFFPIPAIHAIVIPGEDLESRVRFNTLVSRIRGNDKEECTDFRRSVLDNQVQIYSNKSELE